MGCCFSTPPGPDSPCPGAAPNASARHTHPPSLSLPAAPGPASRRRPRRDASPLDQHINRPLRRHQWASEASSDRSWSRRELDTERADFFHTRVTGRPEIWQAIHAALEVLWSDDDGLATAQSILSAAEISLPTGDLANGVYDPFGDYYPLPPWVVADPPDLAQDGHADTKQVHLPASGPDAPADHGDQLAADDAQSRREEKGKAVVDLRERITLRVRLSETGHDIHLTLAKSDTVRNIVRAVVSESALPPSTTNIHLVYLGKVLKENASLEDQGWQSGHVVNAFVFHS